VNDLGGSMAGDGADDAPAAAVVDEITAAGGTAVADTLDISTASGAAGLVARALHDFGRVDIVVGNAGIMRWAPFPDVALEDVGQHLAVHALGSFLVAKAAWPHLAHQGYGRIVLTTSTGVLGLKGNTAYGMAKGGVLGLMRSLALAGRTVGIRANCIAPAASTRMAGEGGPEMPRQWSPTWPTRTARCRARSTRPAPVASLGCSSGRRPVSWWTARRPSRTSWRGGTPSTIPPGSRCRPT
jgi:NAD(P)-dependent dehydrogenase (short-subunit alcohol dehydrogenase family)